MCVGCIFVTLWRQQQSFRSRRDLQHLLSAFLSNYGITNNCCVTPGSLDRSGALFFLFIASFCPTFFVLRCLFPTFTFFLLFARRVQPSLSEGPLVDRTTRVLCMHEASQLFVVMNHGKNSPPPLEGLLCSYIVLARVFFSKSCSTPGDHPPSSI